MGSVHNLSINVLSEDDFTDNGDGTVTDKRTGLMWVQSGYADTDTTPATDYTIDGNWRKYTWENVILYCERLDFAGYTDWRLPNCKELYSILSYEGTAPYINETYFTNTKNHYYRTSTTYMTDTTYALLVNFNSGNMNSNSKTTVYYVRPVRGGV